MSARRASRDTTPLSDPPKRVNRGRENLGYCVLVLGGGRTDPARGGGSDNGPTPRRRLPAAKKGNISTFPLGMKMLTFWVGDVRGSAAENGQPGQRTSRPAGLALTEPRGGVGETEAQRGQRLP